MAHFCPVCGNEIPDDNNKFCFFCGKELPRAAADKTAGDGVAAADETVRIPPAADASGGMDDTGDVAADDTARLPEAGSAGEAEARAADTTAVLPPREPPLPAGPPLPPSPPGPPNRSYPWKWIALIALTGIILAAGGGSALAYFTGNDSATSSKAIKQASSTSDDDKTTKTKTTKTARTSKTDANDTTWTTNTASSSDTQAYITAMDALIAQNAGLQPQIGVLADELNSVAPGGIDETLLYNIDQLGMNFLAINSDTQDLNVPTAFSQSQRDFLQLTSYNIDRCDALYAGATFWRAGQPYESSFEDGRIAKDAYASLYPLFEAEYNAAKAPSQ